MCACMQETAEAEGANEGRQESLDGETEKVMECTLSSYSPGGQGYMKPSTPPSADKAMLRVNFAAGRNDDAGRKKKYLTAKYGQHQMSLIRKRLRVEMWMFDQLQSLYGHRDEDSSSYDVEIDLDELLDIEGDYNRKEWLGGKVVGASGNSQDVEKFISELLQRAKTL